MPVKVSIVVANYNHARFLNERITSLLEQTWKDLEVIIVDDGSTDDSVAIIESFRSDPRVRTLFFETNDGTIFGRANAAATLATGEYLMFANSDDTCDPSQIEKLVRVLDTYPNVGVTSSQSWEIDAEGRRLRIKQQKPRWAADFIVTGSAEAPYILVEPTVQNTSAALTRRALVEQWGGFDLSLGICADWMLFARLLSVSDLAYLAEPLNCYRKHDRTLRTTKRPGGDISEQYHVVDFVLGAFPMAEREKEDAWNSMANKWISKTLMDGWRIDFSQHRRINQVAMRFDPAVHRRLLRLTGGRMLRRLRRRSRELMLGFPRPS